MRLQKAYKINISIYTRADCHTSYVSQLRIKTKLSIRTSDLHVQTDYYTRRISHLQLKPDLPVRGRQSNEKTFTSDKTPIRTRNYESITTRHPYFFAGVLKNNWIDNNWTPKLFACNRKYPRAKIFFSDTEGRYNWTSALPLITTWHPYFCAGVDEILIKHRFEPDYS